MALRSLCLSSSLIATAALTSCSQKPTEKDAEAAAWNYRGRTTNQMFLTEHGAGNRDESLQYYAFVAGNASQTLTQWKTQFIGNAPVHTALYRNKVELGFWREMTCTQLVARGVGGCMVTNWGSPSEPGTGVPDKGTVAMNVSPDGFARFYVFLPTGELSPSAVLDSEGPKFMPRLCTVCHSGLSPAPGRSPDLGSVFREFEPQLLEERPGITRTTAEQEWFRLNRVVVQANLALRSEVDGAPFGVDHAKQSIIDRIDALYAPGGEPDRLPPSWAAQPPETQALWHELVTPYCIMCHRHNAFDWTDYSNFEFLKDGSIKDYLPLAPNQDAPVGAMPQSELTFGLLQNDSAATSAVSRWLGGQAADPNVIIVAPNDGGQAKGDVNLAADHSVQLLMAVDEGRERCPAIGATDFSAPSALVELKNPSSNMVRLAVSTSGPSGSFIPTQLATYKTPPTTLDDRIGCQRVLTTPRAATESLSLEPIYVGARSSVWLFIVSNTANASAGRITVNVRSGF